jgi:Pectate lyase superfamily protein
MTTIVQKADLAGLDFTNNNTNAAGGIGVNVSPTSAVGTAITAANVFLQTGTGAVPRTLLDKAQEQKSVKDYGAVGNGIADDTAAFTAAGAAAAQVHIVPGTYLLNSNVTSTVAKTWLLYDGATLTGVGTLPASDGVIKQGNGSSWVSASALSSGVFGYLEQTATSNVYPKADGVGMFGAARSSTGGGTATAANIGIAAFGLNDYVGGGAGVWGMYSTVLRQFGATGPTHGIEIDVANLGPQISLFPNDMFKAGQSEGVWVCAGGEHTNVGPVYTASCAIAIVRNDSSATPTANFDKGIVFHSKAIVGTDGATGQGVAIAMAKGHTIDWYNNSNQRVSRIVSATTTPSNAQEMVFSDFGTLFVQSSDSGTLFSVAECASAANRLEVAASAAAGSPQLRVQGSDTNIDIVLTPKGTGVLVANYGSSAATLAAAFSATRRLAFKDINNVTWYIPISTVAW